MNRTDQCSAAIIYMILANFSSIFNAILLTRVWRSLKRPLLRATCKYPARCRVKGRETCRITGRETGPGGHVGAPIETLKHMSCSQLLYPGRGHVRVLNAHVQLSLACTISTVPRGTSRVGIRYNTVCIIGLSPDTLRHHVYCTELYYTCMHCVYNVFQFACLVVLTRWRVVVAQK